MSTTSRTAPSSRGPLAEAAALWAGFGKAPGRGSATLLAVLLLVVICCNALGQIQLNWWQGRFYDAIGQRDFAAFGREAGWFLAIIAGLLVLVVAQTWMLELLKLRLRELLTRGLLGRWLQPRRAYLLRFAGEIGEHPDQRVHEDARHLAELGADLSVGLVQSTLLLASFIGVLWALSSSMEITLAGRTWAIPGYMVWCALAYAALGSSLTWVVGRPLIRLNTERYEREAELRFALMQIGETAQSIALYRGETDARHVAGDALDGVMRVGRSLADALAQLTWVTSAYGWGAMIVPVLAAAPAYFFGPLTLGGLMMVIGAFNQVQQALRWYVDNFARIADARATLDRVYAIQEALVRLEQEATAGRIEVVEGAADELRIEELRVRLPTGTATLEGTPLVVRPGDHLLIAGEAGSGKSTVFLALAGLWTAGEGRILLPPGSPVVFLPQHPFFPTGALRQALLYPDGGAPVTDSEIRSALARVDLSHLAEDLDRAARWDIELAPEEQQALALARALLARPRWIVMDETLSGCDEGRRRSMLAMLGRELPNAAVIGTSRFDERDGFWKTMARLRRTNGEGRQRSQSASHWPMPSVDAAAPVKMRGGSRR